MSDDGEQTPDAAPQAASAHARLREALSRRPGWRSLPPQQSQASLEWRAGAYDARGGGSSARVSATGATEEQAVSRLAALLAREG